MTTATKYKPYPTYKPSGIDWLCDIPEGWEVKKIKYISEITLGKMLQPEQKNNPEYFKPYLRAENIRWEKVDIENVNEMWFGTNEMESLRLQKSDLLVSEGGEVGRTAIWRSEMEECYIQNSVNRVRAIEGTSDPNFLLYFFRNLGATGFFEAFVNRVSIAHLTREKLKELIFALPNVAKQKTIADFLDRETARIDDMTAKKQKLMKLLKEKRQALITHAVTKGLDPKAKMKPSGIDWLGDIPEGWEINRLRFVVKTNPSKQETKANSPEIEVSFIPMEAVSEEGEIDLSTTKMIEDVVDGYTYFKDGDVVIAKITPCFENGKGAIMHNLTNSVGFGTTEFHVLRSANIDSKYLYLITRIYPFRAFGEVNMKGAAGQKRVPEDFIKDFSLGLPKIDEQKKIADFLDRETAKIDEVMKKVEMQIEKLQEYRQALITSAVTGKIMVN